MRKAPNFFIIGEPRSGTTSLHDLLAQHPDIFMSHIKEPHCFSSLDFPSPEDEILNITRDHSQYKELFANAHGYKIRGESSTYYLADPESPKLLRKQVPQAKLVAVLRDPIERAYSHYLLYNRRGAQEKSFLETVQENIDNPADQQTLVYHIVELGKYHEHISRYLQCFSKEQLHVVLLDDLMKKPKTTLKQIFAFLGVDESPAKEIELGEAHNSYAQPRNPLLGKLMSNKELTNIGLKTIPRPLLRKLRNDVLLKKTKKPPLDPMAKKLLQQTYEPEVSRLEKLLDRDLGVLRKSWDM